MSEEKKEVLLEVKHLKNTSMLRQISSENPPLF